MVSIRKVMISGGFDPLTIGHLNLIRDARRYGLVIIALNSDRWLLRKRGFCFMPWDHRREILSDLRNVWKVIAVEDTDGTVCSALKRLKPDYFANGGDRIYPQESENKICQELKICQLFQIGGPKVSSSTELIKKAVLSFYGKISHDYLME